MSKTKKVTVKCPKCTSPTVLSIVEENVGTKKQVLCPKCHNKYIVSIPTSFASLFDSDPTLGGKEDDVTMLLETIGDSSTVYQYFELTSDYYSIGRKNNSGPASRPDIEVITTDMKMSRKHAIIKKKGKVGFTIKDMGSKNGVIVNGDKIDPEEEVYIEDGDTFRLGDTKFRVTFSEKSNKYDDLTI